jgi:hypothetical protein
VLAAEGGRTVVLFTTLGALQTLLYTGLFFLVTTFAARAIQRFAQPVLRTAAVGSVVLLLFVSSLLPIYQTPLSSTRLRSDLWHLFE